MNENDKQHIEAICLRHDIRRLNFMEATLFRMAEARQNGTWHRVVNGLIYATSFGGVCGKDLGSLKRYLYIDEDEADTAEQEYFIHLHEIAHLILGHPDSGRDMEAHVKIEIEAWEWALSHAQYEPGDDTLIMIQNALATYTDALANPVMK